MRNCLFGILLINMKNIQIVLSSGAYFVLLCHSERTVDKFLEEYTTRRVHGNDGLISIEYRRVEPVRHTGNDAKTRYNGTLTVQVMDIESVNVY